MAARLAAVVLMLAALSTQFGGCSGYYTPPGRGADMAALGVKPAGVDVPIADALAKRPMAQFPTAVAVARVQAPGYRSMTAEGWGNGMYSVVTTRDVEEPEQVERLAKLPGVVGVAPVNRLLLNPNLQTDQELRQAAAKLHADVLVIYTLDTTFKVEDKALPLSVVTLGLSPNQYARVVCTASAVLMDTRNGYVYGVAERTAKDGQLASAWTSQSAVDDARRRAERDAFKGLVDELEQSWAGVYRTYGTPPVAAVAVPTAVRSPRPPPVAPAELPADGSVYRLLPEGSR